jgi:hypothetical protein
MDGTGRWVGGREEVQVEKSGGLAGKDGEWRKVTEEQGDQMSLWEKISQNVAKPIFVDIRQIFPVEKVPQKFGLRLWFSKKLSIYVIQSPNRRKFAQSGHPAKESKK